MQAAIAGVMQTYHLRVNLTPAQEAKSRNRVSALLKEKRGDEHVLAVEGLKHLLGRGTKRRRRPALPQNCVK
jgi:hypothetical protein